MKYTVVSLNFSFLSYYASKVVFFYQDWKKKEKNSITFLELQLMLDND